MLHAGIHILLLYLWQVVLLRPDFLKAPAKWLGVFVLSAEEPAYDVVPKVSSCTHGMHVSSVISPAPESWRLNVHRCFS